MRWLQTLGVMVALMLAWGCTPKREVQTPSPGAASIKVLSYNVNYGLVGDASGIAAIRDANADVVLLQETNEGWEQAIRAELSELYPHMQFRHCCQAGGLAVLSKYAFEKELTPTPADKMAKRTAASNKAERGDGGKNYQMSKDGWFPAWRVVVETQAGPIQLLNVHLRPPVSDSGSVVSGYFSTPPIREKEMRQFHHMLKAGMPGLVAGDFNESGSGRAVTFLEKRGYRSALPEFDTSQSTWHWNTSVGTVSSQLDHIVYGDGLRPLRAEVLRKGQSDHYPVQVTFVVAPSNTHATKPQSRLSTKQPTSGSSLSSH